MLPSCSRNVHPYPDQFVSRAALKNGTAVTVRPIRSDDESKMVKFHETLSDRTVYLRYFHSMSLDRRVEHARLAQICDCDYDREMVLVAEMVDAHPGEKQIIGVGRLNKLSDGKRAEIAVVISDSHQGKGLGSILVERLVKIAHAENISRLEAEMLYDNLAMQTLLKRFGFRLHALADPNSVQAVLEI